MAEVTRAELDQLTGTVDAHKQALNALLDADKAFEERIKALEDRPALKGEKGEKGDKGDKGDAGTSDPALEELIKALEGRITELERQHAQDHIDHGVTKPEITEPADGSILRPSSRGVLTVRGVLPAGSETYQFHFHSLGEPPSFEPGPCRSNADRDHRFTFGVSGSNELGHKAVGKYIIGISCGFEQRGTYIPQIVGKDIQITVAE